MFAITLRRATVNQQAIVIIVVTLGRTQRHKAQSANGSGASMHLNCI
jgi:hypothetical protein